MKRKIKKIILFTIAGIFSCTIMSFMVSNKKTKISSGDDTKRLAPVDMNRGYHIKNYIIDPSTKTIAKQRKVGGVNWDGYGYFPDTTICFDTTSLIFISGNVDFKERFSGVDFKTIRPISYADRIFRDKNNIYRFDKYRPSIIKSFKGLKTIDDDAFLDKEGNIIYFSSITNAIEGWSSPIKPHDINSLKHLVDNFFIDNSGLYNAGDSDLTDLLIHFDDTIPPFQIFDSFIRVGNKLFIRNRYKTIQLDLDPSKVKEFARPLYDKLIDYFITDGNKTYYFNTEEPNDSFTEIKKLRGIDLGEYIKLPYSISNILNFYFSNLLLFYNCKTNTFIKLSRKDWVSPFIPKQLDKIKIENKKTGKVELFNPQKYKFLINDLFVYDNCLYSHDASPVLESFDVPNLHQVEKDKIKANFVTDNKRLLYAGETGGYTSQNDSIVKEKMIADNIDFKSLEILTPNILIDVNNIYVGGDPITIIPRNKLGIKIEIYN